MSLFVWRPLTGVAPRMIGSMQHSRKQHHERTFLAPANSDGPSDGRYTVIARRYRPQAFDELRRARARRSGAEQAISSNELGTPTCFTGARGVGKTSAARILAKALNCVQGPTPTPCNECDVCLRVTAGDDVDVLEIDGASNRGIDEIRQLRRTSPCDRAACGTRFISSTKSTCSRRKRLTRF